MCRGFCDLLMGLIPPQQWAQCLEMQHATDVEWSGSNFSILLSAVHCISGAEAWGAGSAIY